MLTVDLLPARRGDCLWIEYGDPAAPRRVLIDGGIARTYDTLRARLEALPPDRRRLELLVITHFDLDHIAGVLELLRDPPEGLVIGDVWFNDWDHLPEDDGVLGAKQAESVAAHLELGRYPWNEAFGGRTKAAALDPTADLPVLDLADDLKITLLSPTFDRLRRLRSAWQKELDKAGLTPGEAGRELEGLGHPEERVEDDGVLGDGALDIEALAAEDFKEDTSRANGSSIAFVLEHDGKRCLFAGDAFPSDLTTQARKLAAAEGTERLAVDALKVSHHGGHKNTSPELLQALSCPTYLISSDGSYYDHPRPQTLARIVTSVDEPRLVFNYRSEENEVWDDRWLRRKHRYGVEYPGDGEEPGVSVRL